MFDLVEKEIFTVITNTDLTEGRGYGVRIAYCVSESTAKRLAVGRGVMGCDADVRKEKAYTRNGSEWFAPVSVTFPSGADVAMDELLTEKQKVMNKAQQFLSKEEIDILMRG